MNEVYRRCERKATVQTERFTNSRRLQDPNVYARGNRLPPRSQTIDSFEPVVENFVVMKQNCSEGLTLRTRREFAFDGQMRQKLFDASLP